MKRVMIDLETLGLNVPKPNAVVWSIGLTFWDSEEGYMAEYEFSPDVLSQIMRGRIVDPSTVKWWQTQKHCPIDALGNTNDVKTILSDIQNLFIKECPREVWANAPDFDCAILQSLGGDFGFSMPWNHQMQRDVRTLRKLFGHPDDDVKSETAHDVLKDNRDQIYSVMSILNRLKMYEDTATQADHAQQIEQKVAKQMVGESSAPRITD